jgi:hypothetical protein
MERFFLSSIGTCLKSGTLLFVAGILIVFALRLAEWTVVGGVITIAVGAVVYGRSLARAGFDAMLVRLSPFSRAKSVLLVFIAITFNAIGYVVLFAFGFVGLELDLDLARVLALIAAVAYLPASVLIATTLID